MVLTPEDRRREDKVELLTRLLHLIGALESLERLTFAGLAYIIDRETLDRMLKEVDEPLIKTRDALEKLFKEIVPETERLHFRLLDIYRWVKENYWSYGYEIEKSVREFVKRELTY